MEYWSGAMLLAGVLLRGPASLHCSTTPALQFSFPGSEARLAILSVFDACAVDANVEHILKWVADEARARNRMESQDGKGSLPSVHGDMAPRCSFIVDRDFCFQNCSCRNRLLLCPSRIGVMSGRLGGGHSLEREGER